MESVEFRYSSFFVSEVSILNTVHSLKMNYSYLHKINIYHAKWPIFTKVYGLDLINPIIEYDVYY